VFENSLNPRHDTCLDYMPLSQVAGPLSLAMVDGPSRAPAQGPLAMMYPSDLTDTEWHRLQPLWPSPARRGRPRRWALRHIVNGISYLLRAGCPWRFLPQGYPPWATVSHDFRRWQQTGLWHLMHETLRQAVRVKASGHPLPSAAIMDSQRVKTTVESGTIKGDDGPKHVKGRKRHRLVDTLGMLVSVCVTPADTADRTGAPW
jgi:putative transposase